MLWAANVWAASLPTAAELTPELTAARYMRQDFI
jgi:hypothetical protein